MDIKLEVVVIPVSFFFKDPDENNWAVQEKPMAS
jgi:hypothetical protein